MRELIVFIDGLITERRSNFKTYSNALSYAKEVIEAKPWARVEIYWDESMCEIKSKNGKEYLSGY